MTRMTKSISLVLIGSSLILAGCRRQIPPEEQVPPGAGGGGTGGGFRGGYYHRPWSSTYRTPRPPNGGFHPGGGAHPSGGSGKGGGHISSHSGGFGSTGHAAGS